MIVFSTKQYLLLLPIKAILLQPVEVYHAGAAQSGTVHFLEH